MPYFWKPDKPSWAVSSDGAFYRLWWNYYLSKSPQSAVLHWFGEMALCIEDKKALSYRTLQKLTVDFPLSTDREIEWRKSRYRQALENVGLSAEILLGADKSCFDEEHKESLDMQLQKLCYFIKKK